MDAGNRNPSRLAELCLARVMCLVPKPYRFGAALLLARIALPLVRKTEAYREQQIKMFHRPREIALHLVLNALTKNGTAFDPRIRVSGFDHFVRAQARGKGVLVIGHHAALSLFMVRHFYDKGFDPVVITPDSKLRVGGTLVSVRILQPSPMFLVQLRSRLRRGELVCGMPDRGEHHMRRTIEFAMPSGRVILAPAMIQVAARCGAEVLFTEVHIEGRQLVSTIASPSRAARATAESLTEEFISFVRDHSLEHGDGDAETNGVRSRGLRNSSGSPGESGLAAPQWD